MNDREQRNSKGSVTRMNGGHASASDREGDEAVAEQVRRRTFKGRSKSSDKCGVCKNCMNPHWKQKCVLLKDKKEGNMPRKASAGSGEAKSENENDVFVEELRQVLADDGGIRGVEKVSSFLTLTKRASDWGQRLAMLRVLQNSGKPVLERVVGSEGLLVLEKWLNDSIEAKRIKFISESLTTLTRLPITLQSLKKPCEIGKAVGKLRKSEELSEDIKSQARILVTKWKSLVSNKASGPGLPSATVVKQEMSLPSKVDAQKAGRPKLDDDDIFIPKAKTSSLSTQAQHSTKRVVTSNAAQIQKRDMNKTEVARVSASPLDSITMDSSSKFKKQTPSSEVPSTSKAETASPAAPIVLFGPISAKQRAKMAADKVPDEPPRQKKPINKKIRWPSDDVLEDVRWFLQKQAPAMAKKDAGSDDDEATETIKEEETPEHKNFVSAARKEHQSEAIALKEHREHESKEREILTERLHLMRPTVLWRDPPFLQAKMLTDNEVAFGEDSVERPRLVGNRLGSQAKIHSSTSEAPPTPKEPPQGSSGPPQPLHMLTKIPLSVEEARRSRQNTQTMLSGIGLAIGHLPSSPPSPTAHTSMMTSRQAPFTPKSITKTVQAIHRPMTKSAQPKLQPMLGLHGPAIKHPVQNTTVQRPMQSMSGTKTTCMYYNTPRGCIHGDNCRFAHETPTQAAIQPMKRARGPTPNVSAQPRKMVRQSTSS
eukprot:jgi/Picsp_1/6778/NSC_04118-R1_protein phosphatase regulatory subunit 10